MGYKKVNVIEVARGIEKSWLPVRLGLIDDYEFKVAIFDGEYKPHKHVKHDELLFVIEGSIREEFEDGTEIEVNQGEGIFIEKDTVHKSKSEGRAVVVVVEKVTIANDYVWV
jgi:mannose-6-phosphate isomerase-like protein (cupin superfamily)